MRQQRLSMLRRACRMSALLAYGRRLTWRRERMMVIVRRQREEMGAGTTVILLAKATSQ
jgi:hypothetical protein